MPEAESPEDDPEVTHRAASGGIRLWRKSQYMKLQLRKLTKPVTDIFRKFLYGDNL